MRTHRERYVFRRERVRDRLRELAARRPRLSVHRSLRYIYAQVIDDGAGKTLAFASSLSKEIKAKLKSGKGIDAARAVGDLVARKALEAGVKKVAFDRGGRIYHGRVKAVADAARAAGLEF